MATTGSRGGKRSASVAEATKRHLKRADWGTRHWLHQNEWGNRAWFVGSGEKEFTYKDPNTGTTVTILADDAKDAARQAKNAGLVKKRKR